LKSVFPLSISTNLDEGLNLTLSFQEEIKWFNGLEVVCRIEPSTGSRVHSGMSQV
jgi:hypothetical protein